MESRLQAILFVLSVALRSSMGEEEGEGNLPPGLKIPTLPAPRVSMDTINTMNQLAPPAPMPWPKAFSVAFVTNVTEKEWSSENALPAAAIAGRLWYDSTQSGQRVLHGAGSRECDKFYGSKDACTLVFNTDGMYAFVPDQQHCCFDMPGLFVPPPNWTLATHKFVGTQRIRGRMCHGFSYIPGTVTGLQGRFHEYWQDVVTFLPCLFTFPGEERMAWVFDASSLVVGEQDAAMFAVPATCRAASCSPSRVLTADDAATAEAADLWKALYEDEEEGGELAGVVEEVVRGLTAEQRAVLAAEGRRRSALHQQDSSSV